MTTCRPTLAWAFVVVTHQHPQHASVLSESLARHTPMPVVDAGDGMQVEPDYVYVTPPGAKLGMLNGAIVVTRSDASSATWPSEVVPFKTTATAPAGGKQKQTASAGNKKGGPVEIHLPIGSCLRSVAEDVGHRAVGIILSGTGSDGTSGLRAIKAAGGIVIVQQPEPAKFDGMPRNAIGSGIVDLVVPPREMPGELAALAEGHYLDSCCPPIPDEALRKLLVSIRSRTGNDFSLYKSTTIRLRIERRMSIHRIRSANAYVKFLQDNTHETELLFKELLICVKSFFRVADAFAVLADGPLDELMRSRADGHTFRAWVPGCVTGEEAYSLAILLRELAERHEKNFGFKIFATDLDASAIEMARTGN